MIDPHGVQMALVVHGLNLGANRDVAIETAKCVTKAGEVVGTLEQILDHFELELRIRGAYRNT